MNWLDIVLVAIMALAVILGIVKGLAKQVVGLVAAVAGLILAVIYYKDLAGVFDRVVKNGLLSHFLAFLLIFFLVVIAGAILGHLITKAMKGPLAVANRLSGGVFGAVKGVLICGVLVFALITFGVARPALETSVVAPVCVGVTRIAIDLIPKDLRDQFYASYKQIRKSGGAHGQKI
jgi:membrane protein required for colicin V production